jgi:glycosyltransferase involved in cell wall biosynthesis
MKNYGLSKRSTVAGDTTSSPPTFLSHESPIPQTGEIVVDGLRFTDVKRTKHKNNSVGFNDKYIIKIEHDKHPLKLRSLLEEIEIIKYLNSKECVSCPRLFSEGRLKTGERYFIQERIDGQRGFNTADMVLSILEQKSLGICQGDLKIENFIFDSDSVCHIIDYDQAIYDERFVQMGNIEYFEWIAQYIVNRWRKYGITDFYKSYGLNRDEIFSLFKNGAFNLAAATIFKEQITTDSDSGIYHSLNTDKIYIEGARDLNPRLGALNAIEFKKAESVLDVGCNMGLLGHYLHDRGCAVTGIDIDRKIIIGAKMVANILNKNIQFKWLDVDEARIEQEYDTICLFSVIHHVKNFKQVTENVAQRCNRIILECGLKEHGSKPIKDRWTATGGWDFNSVGELVSYLETVFRGFRFQDCHGSVDRNRQIMTFAKKPTAATIQVQSEPPPIIKEDELAAQQLSDESKYLVSTVVSTYNSEHFIRGCLEDLENQTIADKLEIIVVDSGSQQNEGRIVEEFQKKYGNIKYIKTEHREGVYAAWNRAVKVAQGRFITNANTDDRHRGDALQIMANELLANPDIALVYADQIRTDTPNDTFAGHHGVEMLQRPDYNRQRLLFGCCVGSQPMWRKSLHGEFGYFDETLTCAGDWDFWLRISQRYSFKHIPEFLGLYYYNPDGIEHGKKIHSLYERYAVGKRYGTPYMSGIPLYEARGNPLVSVWMAAYNAADYIARAIESVLVQNYRNFELIIVDDGSTDRTADIVRSFKDEPIKYFFKEHGGAASARNLGLRKSGGSFIVILDSDDMMMPDFIARHLQIFEQHPEVDMVYCDDCCIDEEDRPISKMNKPEYSDQNALISDLFRWGWAIVPFRTCIRKSVFDKIGLYDERLIVSEDYDMVRRFINHGLRMRHLPAALYLRRLRANSLSRSFNAAKAKGHFDVVRKFTETFTAEQLFPDVRWDKLPAEQRLLLAKCKTALVYIGIGEQYLGSKAPDFAEAAFEMACEQLEECCKIEPANPQVSHLLEKCRLIRATHLPSDRQPVCSLV